MTLESGAEAAIAPTVTSGDEDGGWSASDEVDAGTVALPVAVAGGSGLKARGASTVVGLNAILLEHDTRRRPRKGVENI